MIPKYGFIFIYVKFSLWPPPTFTMYFELAILSVYFGIWTECTREISPPGMG